MNEILQRLSEHANTIEAALHGYIETQKEKIPQPLLDSVRYSLYKGGKRIRPALTMEFCRLFGGSDAQAIPLACAVECVHTYSLIHDDLPCMDDDDERRSKPTNHRVFGEDTALLAGDGLLTFAFELIADRSTAAKEQTIAAIRILAQAAGMVGMVGGQQLDLNGVKQKPNLEEVFCVHRKKTAALLRAACLLGVCAAGYANDNAKCKAATDYAEHLGMAFQIVDDLLDYKEPINLLGEPMDINEPVSVMHFLDKEQAKELAQQHTQAAIAALDGIPNHDILVGLANHLAKRRH